MKKTALILEGGGFRGVWTSGVLDALMEENIEFPYGIGVSMGACNGASYVTKQIGRNKVVNIAFLDDSRYKSWRRWFLEGELFGMDFIFREIPEHIVPFDFEAFAQSPMEYEVVGTNCESGLAEYYPKNGRVSIMESLTASVSLPLISNVKWIDGKPCLDGGIADPIPLQRALDQGNDRVVVVLTQTRDYEKKQISMKRLLKWKYRKYPKLVDLLLTRHERYNETRGRLFELEKQGRAFIIAPQTPIAASRLERSADKLELVFDQGYGDMKRQMADLKTFLYNESGPVRPGQSVEEVKMDQSS